MKIYSLLVVTAYFVALVYAKGQIDLRVQKITCTVNDPLTVHMEVCAVKAINRTTTIINIAGNYTRPVKTFLINSQLFKKSEIKYRPFLVNVTDDLCEFFSKKKASPYFRIVWPIINAHTSLNHECPYFGYNYVKDLPVDEDKIPAVWPQGNYLLEVLFHEANNNKLLTSQIYFEIKLRPFFN